MKSILYFSLIFSFIFSLSAFGIENKNEIGMLIGTSSAMKLVRVKTYQDFSKAFELPTNDQKLFLNDLKNKKLLGTVIPSFEYQNAKLTFLKAPKDVTFDFTQIASGYLYMNGHKIDVSHRIPYVKALIFVQDVLKEPAQNAWYDLFLPKAMASESKGSKFEYLWSAVISSDWMGVAQELKLRTAKFALAETINQTFDNSEHKDIFPEFTCKDGRLNKIQSPLDVDSGYDALQFTPGKGYSGEFLVTRYGGDKDSRMSHCKFVANEEGIIVQLTESKQINYTRDNIIEGGIAGVCPKKGASIFKIHSQPGLVDKIIGYGVYGEYPKVADACCQDTTHKCAEKVKAHIQQYYAGLKTNSGHDHGHSKSEGIK